MATSELAKKLLANNNAYAAKVPAGQLELGVTPAHKLAVLTCMDARLEPMRILGLEPGDAHVLRTAGGRVRPSVVASLVLSARMLGTTDWIVMHHTDCAAVAVTDEQMDELMHAQKLPHEDAASLIDVSNPEALAPAVVADVRTLRENPNVPASIVIYGFVYDVKTAKLHEIEEASQLGQAGN